jgi:tRNA A-37 threonylcarbamoyl transferase component Bud32
MPRFAHIRQLGSGTFGTVYACREEDEHGNVLQENLAIKLLNDEWLDDEHARGPFRREARLARGLEHPGIVEILYSNLSARRPYIVMPLAASTLAEQLAGGRAGDREWALELFGQLLGAIAYAHERGVVHRDLKPDNVLFLGPRPVIGDFGMGKELDALSTGATNANQALGTLAYMAPEQWVDASRVSYPADVFSLGKLLWELLANRSPRPWAPELELIDDEELRGFIERCCEEEPSLRYRDAGDALRAWELLVGQLAPVRAPLDRATALVEEFGRSPEGSDIKVIRRLHALLDANRDEELLYYDVVPQLPERLIARYCECLPGEFATVLGRFVAHIEGDLPFDYCDEVARFYAVVFRVAQDEAVLRVVLSELLSLGVRHERYAVADVVREVLWEVHAAGDVRLVVDVVGESSDAWWYRHWQTFNGPLDRRVARALEGAREPDPAEGHC